MAKGSTGSSKVNFGKRKAGHAKRVLTNTALDLRHTEVKADDND